MANRGISSDVYLPLHDSDGENHNSNGIFDYSQPDPSQTDASKHSIRKIRTIEGGKSLNHLGLFAKFWQPGAVKTRLAATIGEVSACELYQAFLFHLLERHRNSAHARSVVFSPTQRASEFQASIPPFWNLVPQATGNLGQRMQLFFEEQFERMHATGYSDAARSPKIVVIGADCPQLSQVVIQHAYHALDDHDVVIGPSTDGGYYLIGMREKCFEVFSNIQWSTPGVLEQTTQLLESQGIVYHLLSPLTDVDDFASMLELVSDLKSRTAHGELDALDAELYRKISLAVDQVTEWESE